VSTLRNTLFAGSTGQAFAWTFGNAGLVYHVNHDRVSGKITLGPGALKSWVYSPAVQKLVITHYDDPRVYFPVPRLQRVLVDHLNVHSFGSRPRHHRR
jgi:hypothetical protein